MKVEDVKILVICDSLRIHDHKRVLDLLVAMDSRAGLFLEHLLTDIIQISQGLVVNHTVVPVPGVFE